MRHITIIGLGPGSPKHLTCEAWDILSTANEVWLRTAHHPVVTHLPDVVQLHTFDHLYESADTFEAVYLEIAEKIVALAQDDDVYYAVPGHPFVGESTVTHIVNFAELQSIPVKIVAGLSFIEPLLTALRFDALDGLQVFDALDILALNHPPINPDFPVVISQVYSRHIASELKLVLMNQYSDEYEVTFLDAAGTDAGFVKQLPLYEIDRLEATPLTSLYVPALPKVGSFEAFQQTVAKLRAPDGCPWDREQTHKTLRTNLIEEAYEVLLAIDEGDELALQEELGDLLLQVVLHTQIAIEDGEFYMTDVISGIDEKLKRRHPHVWGTTAVDGSDDVLMNWEAIKQRERKDKGLEHRSMLDGIPVALPSLTQAAEYIKRVERVGLQWPSDSWLLDAIGASSSVKVVTGKEWIGTLVQFQNFLEKQSEETAMKVLGEVLLRLVRIAVALELDLESILREANARFVKRFKYLEVYSRQQEISFDSLTVEQVVALLNDLTKQTPHR